MEKVLIIAYNDLNNSGVPNVIYQTILALHDEHRFDVLVFGDDDYYYQRLRSEGVNINLIKYIDEKPKSKIGRLFWRFFKRPRNHYLFMKKLLYKNDYCAVHSFKEYDCWPFFKAATEAGIKKRIFHCNVNLTIDKSAKDRFLKYRNRRLSLKYANIFIGVSELSCINAFGKKPYTVLCNAYDDQRYNMSVDNLLRDDELVITQVASYGDNKNQLFSLQVLKELKNLVDVVKLNLVGAYGMTRYYHSLIDYVKTNNLVDNVSFIDRNDNVTAVYKRTTFVIIPSLKEGFSLVAIEAQACGIEVIASSSIPREIDCGGVTFLRLSKGPSLWAKEIYDKYLKKRNIRVPFEIDKFTFKNFKTSLKGIYNS